MYVKLQISVDSVVPFNEISTFSNGSHFGRRVGVTHNFESLRRRLLNETFF